MKVKINHEIKTYTESMFFGLSLRQCVFSVLACGVATMIYFTFKATFGTEIVSWLCILGIAPFIFFGFFTYNGMNAEQFISFLVKSLILSSKVLVFNGTATYRNPNNSNKKNEV